VTAAHDREEEGRIGTFYLKSRGKAGEELLLLLPRPFARLLLRPELLPTAGYGSGARRRERTGAAQRSNARFQRDRTSEKDVVGEPTVHGHGQDRRDRRGGDETEGGCHASLHVFGQRNCGATEDRAPLVLTSEKKE